MTDSRPASLIPASGGVVWTDFDVGGICAHGARPMPENDLKATILMIHGAFTGWWIWRNWLTEFALNGWQSYALSLRGHEGSRPLSNAALLETHISDYVGDVLSVLPKVGTCVLIGHSLGGIVAQKVVEQAGARALVLVASVGPGQLGPHDADYAEDSPVEFRESYAADRERYRVPDDVFADVVARLVPESPKALNDGHGRTPVERHLIACPILVIGADRDETKVPAAERIAAFYSSPYVVIEDSAHDVMVDHKWRDVALLIDAWLHSVLSFGPTSETGAIRGGPVP